MRYNKGVEIMENLFTKKVPLHFETEVSQLILGDSFEILTKMKPESVDMIFADPPYFLSNDGITCKGGKMVSVNKGSWDKLSLWHKGRRFLAESSEWI